MASRLSPNMRELLNDCATARDGCMYVRWGSSWERTAQALRSRGLVTLRFAVGGFSNQYEVRLTDEGRRVMSTMTEA